MNIEHHHNIFKELYADVSGYALSHEARVNNDAPQYVYGEIDFESFVALLSLYKPNKDTVFYDLGSGTGKAVITCAMMFDVKKSCGIEYFSNLTDCAKKQQQRLSQIPEYAERAKAIEFIQGDFLTSSVQDATIMFINSTAFLGDYWAIVSKHLEQLKVGTIVITCSKAVASPCFSVQEVKEVIMSWGTITMYIQSRVALSVDNIE